MKDKLDVIYANKKFEEEMKFGYVPQVLDFDRSDRWLMLLRVFIKENQKDG